MQQQLIKYLCDSSKKERHLYPELDQRVLSYLLEKKVVEVQFDFHHIEHTTNFVDRLSAWRKLFQWTLLISFREIEEDYKEKLKEFWYQLTSQNSLKSFQIEQAYTQLVAFLLDIPYTMSSTPFQLDSGFTPIESSSLWPLLTAPLLEWQAELGTLWVLLGRFLDLPNYLESAQKLANWQIKSLDENYQTFKGFLASHHYSHYANTMLWQGVFFHAVALALQNSEMAYLAKQQFSSLLSLNEEQLKGFSSAPLLILDWIELAFKEERTPVQPQLEPVIQDPDLALVGLRSKELNISISLLGANMGFGSLKSRDIEIPAFGPQMELLGESLLFGMIGQNPVGQSNKNRFQVDSDQRDFNIKGVVGLPKVHFDQDPLKTWRYPADWMETNIFFEENALNINLTPYSVHSKLFLVFYVIAKKCLINGEEKIFPHSLNQYQGEAFPVSFVGEESILILDSLNHKSQLKVIPLEGHQSFWGANYLIAYHLNNKYSTFKWKISMRDL